MSTPSPMPAPRHAWMWSPSGLRVLNVVVVLALAPMCFLLGFVAPTSVLLISPLHPILVGLLCAACGGLTMLMFWWGYGFLHRLIARICFKKGQLFPTYSAWSFWWVHLPQTPRSTRQDVQTLTQLQSKEREEVMRALDRIRNTRHFHSFCQSALPQTYKSNYSSIPMWEELIKAGALLPRFDSKFYPLTFVAVSNHTLHVPLLELILAAGADINDDSAECKTILDHYIAAQDRERFNFDDAYVLMEMGARPTRTTLSTLEDYRVKEDLRADLDKLIARVRRELLHGHVQSEDSADQHQTPVRPLF